MGEDLFIDIDRTLKKLDFDCNKLISVTIDSGRYMSGINKGLVGKMYAKIEEEDIMHL